MNNEKIMALCQLAYEQGWKDAVENSIGQSFSGYNSVLMANGWYEHSKEIAESIGEKDESS